MNRLKFENQTEKQKILIELNDKNTLINRLNTSNDEHTQNIQRLKKELNDKEIPLDEYKKKIRYIN